MSNVGEITQRLIDIVQANPDLQGVWIRGKISNVRCTQNGTLNFMLTDNSEKIQCVIFNDRESLQENLPEAGNNVFVKGQIYVNEKKSEYRFKVTDINRNSSSPQPVSVSTLTNTLKATLSVHSGEVQGEISEVFVAPAGFTIFKLKDVTADGQFDIIECVLPPEIDPPFPLETGERVNVTGQFGIFEKASAYRIEIDKTNKITQVTKPPGSGKTKRNKCKRCPLFFYNLKNGLCPTCFDADLTSEGIVVGAVERYFKQFKNLSTQREYPIQFGSKQGRSDVVLKDSKNRLSAIAECKHIEYDGTSGIEQLESYLNASGTTLGLFADDTDPNGWTFLKNLGKGKFAAITRSDFETMVRGEKAQPSPEPRNPNPTPLPIPSNSASRLWQYITGVLGVALCICLTVLIMQLDEKNRQIQEFTRKNSKLESENKTLENENQNLQEQITEKEEQIKDNARNILQLKNEIEDLQEKLAEKQAIIDSYLKPGVQPPPIPNGKKPGPEPPRPKPVPLPLNINTATAKELDDLPVPGIGEALSKRIIQYRKQNGNFANVDDITKVSGIGEKTLEKLREFIYVE